MSARMKDIKHDRDAADERKVLGDYLALTEKEAEASAKAKAAQEDLTEKIVAKYGVSSPRTTSRVSPWRTSG
ncbi:MAG: hypothetical protein R3B06_30705 [Kofleriaceae bacterium]